MFHLQRHLAHTPVFSSVSRFSSQRSSVFYSSRSAISFQHRDAIAYEKIALMGYRSVGKSTLTAQYIDGTTTEFYDPTVENTLVKRVKIKGQEYMLKIIDTAGQDEYSIFPPQYTMDIDGFCLVYSIDSQKSFEVVRALHDKLLDLVGSGSNRLPIVLVGNKNDLANDRAVTYEDGQALAKAMKARFVELSAKQSQEVNSLFEKLVISIEGTRSADDGPSKQTSKCLIS